MHLVFYRCTNAVRHNGFRPIFAVKVGHDYFQPCPSLLDIALLCSGREMLIYIDDTPCLNCKAHEEGR